jgi:formylmethanofuran dehydrogenase subunit A
VYIVAFVNERVTNPKGNKMTTTNDTLEWAPRVPHLIPFEDVTASGPGYVAHVFFNGYGGNGWQASVELSNGQTLTSLGHLSPVAAKEWAALVVNEYS